MKKEILLISMCAFASCNALLDSAIMHDADINLSVKAFQVEVNLNIS